MISPEVQQDIANRSKTFGLVLGLLSLPTAFVGGVLGSCCPLGSAVGVVPVVAWAGLSGLLAAMFLDWGRIEHEDGIRVGATCGMRTGLLASAIGAGITFLIALFGAGVLGTSMAEHPGQGAGFAAGYAVMNLIVTVIAVIPGTLFGAVGGVIGAAIKRK